jgi:hypothetical protein
MAEIEAIMSRHGMAETKKDKLLNEAIAWKDHGSNLVEMMIGLGLTPEEMECICQAFENKPAKMILDRSPLLPWKEERKHNPNELICVTRVCQTPGSLLTQINRSYWKDTGVTNPSSPVGRVLKL